MNLVGALVLSAGALLSDKVVTVSGVRTKPVLSQFPLIPHIKSLKMPSFEAFYENALKDVELQEKKQEEWRYQPVPPLR